jgi:hypothetical protein
VYDDLVPCTAASTPRVSSSTLSISRGVGQSLTGNDPLYLLTSGTGGKLSTAATTSAAR